jgi:tyrosyl-tRNA synthetase
MMGQRPQQCFLVPLLVGTDGAVKMSKSLGNYIAVEEPPQDQYGKVMSLPDSAILMYFDLVTDLPDRELAEMGRALEHHAENPMTLKKRLAYEVVKLLNSADDARQAQEHFERTVQRGEIPEDMPTVKVALDAARLSRVLVDAGLASSMGDARRLITQRAVEVNGVTATADELPKPLAAGDVIRVGKRRYARVVD